jgi:UPF0271 protein
MLLNVDLGELPDEPEALYAYAHVANVACGGHAGDGESMRRAIELCQVHGALVGAHPSYPDREGFGRRPVAMPPAALQEAVAEQCSRLAAVAASLGRRVERVKAHGALYHTMRDDVAIARAVAFGSRDALGEHITLVGPPEGQLRVVASDAGLAYAREGFADRGTRSDGTLVPRGEPGALIVDPAAAAARARELAATGRIETVCVHGDTPGSVDIARAVREALEKMAGRGGEGA